MKRIVVALFAVLLTLPAFAIDTKDNDRRDNARNANIADEVIRMWKSNVAEEEIISYVRKADTHYVITADDVIDMSEAKVPRTIIKAVLDQADYRGDTSRPAPRRVVVAPYYGSYGYYGPAYYDPWYYDPFWYGYGPRISIGFGFGSSRFYGGRHFRRWR